MIKTDNKQSILLSAANNVALHRYEIIGRGNLVQAATVRGTGRTRNEVVVPGFRDMSPHARIIVSYTRDTGEIVADAMDFDVDGFMSNGLELQMNARSSIPGV